MRYLIVIVLKGFAAQGMCSIVSILPGLYFFFALD